VRKVGVQDDVVLSGGCSKNEGLALALENVLGVKIKKLPIDPQFMGAIGAAVFAMEKKKVQSGRAS
jgi:activator of 2-hydroxyglutaryl-CoA dehydratase